MNNLVNNMVKHMKTNIHLIQSFKGDDFLPLQMGKVLISCFETHNILI